MKKSIYLLVLIFPIMSCASAGESSQTVQQTVTDNSTEQVTVSAPSASTSTSSSGGSNAASNNSSSSNTSSGSIYRITSFSDIIGKNMRLIEVYIGGRNINFSRNSLPQVLADAYIIKFDERVVSGMAAPNRFTAPYTLSASNHISIAQMATTMMASLIEPENLKEQEFIIYMQNAWAWMDENGKFVLLCNTATGQEVRMLFEFF